MSFPLSRSSRRRVDELIKPGVSKAERDEILKQYGMPASPTEADRGAANPSSSSSSSSSACAVFHSLLSTLGSGLLSAIHYLVYALLCLFVSVCIRARYLQYFLTDFGLRIRYYHHDNLLAIQGDVAELKLLPEHLSVLLTLDKADDGHEDRRMRKLIDQAADLAVWSACAGIPLLSVYEPSGILKSYMPSLHRAITKRLAKYYKPDPSRTPILNLYAPHKSVYKPAAHVPTPAAGEESENTEYLTVLLLSEHDGRDTFIDLVKTLTELAQNEKIAPHDITVELVNTELCEIMAPLEQDEQSAPASASTENSATATPTPTSATATATADTSLKVFLKPEPDFLLLFSPCVKLRGFPPWQIRLTEMYCTGNEYQLMSSDAETVEYHKFLKGLWRYAKAEMRFGR